MTNWLNMSYKNIFLLTILLITISLCIRPLNSFALEENKKERGWKGKLCKKLTCKDELLQKLRNLKEPKHWLDEGEYVEGYIIKGSDIIEIIKESDIDIKIKNSVIEGGLDFRKLPVVKEKREVNNKIIIRNSEIGFRDLGVFGKRSVDSSSILFNKRISFWRTQFSEWADFSGAQFSGVTTHFSHSQFSGKADFFKAQFSEKASFWKTQFSEEAEFTKAQFNGEASFKESRFIGDTVFTKTQFSGDTVFTKAQFNGEANFSGAQFSGETNFIGATFKKLAFFQNAILNDKLILDAVLFQEYADFRNTTIRRLNWNNTSPTIITGRIDLREARITESHFENLIFENDVDFSDVEFGIGLLRQNDFIDFSTFVEVLAMQADSKSKNPSKRISEDLFNTDTCKDTNKEDLSYFYTSPLSQSYNTFSVNLSDYSELRTIKNLKVCISMDDKFKMRIIKDLNSLLNSMYYYKKEYFKDIKIGTNEKNLLKRGIKNLSEEEVLKLNLVLFISAYSSHLDIPANLFRFVTFESDVRFLRTEFYSDIAFEDVYFEKGVNFTNANFKPILNRNPKFSLSYIDFNDLIIEFKQLPEEKNWVLDSKDRVVSFVDEDKNDIARELQPFSEVLAGLEAVFSRNKMLGDKNKAHYHMKVEELKEAITGKWLYAQIFTWEVGDWVLWGWSSGYGTKLWWIVGWYSAGLFFFAFIFYRLSEMVTKKDTGEIKPDSEFRMRLINFPWYFMKSVEIKNEELKDFFIALRLSKVLLLKVGRRDTEVEGKLMKSIVWIEWAFGYYLLGVLVITLKNTVPIINSLISGVF